MCVLAVGENAQLAKHCSTQGVLGQHTLYRQFDNALGRFLLQIFKRYAFQVTDVPRVPVIHFILSLIAGNTYLGSINNDYVVASIHMRRVYRLVLAAQSPSSLGCDLAECLALSIDNKPLPFDFGRLRTDRGLG